MTIPPEFEELQHYCLSRRNGIDPQAWMDYYQSVGWLIGKKKMKDWQAAVRTGERRNKPVNTEQQFIHQHTARDWAEDLT